MTDPSIGPIYPLSHAPYSPLWANVTSSTKPEVQNVFRRDRATAQVTCTENFVRFGHVVFEICERTDRQTHRHRDTLIAILRTPIRGELIILAQCAVLREHYNDCNVVSSDRNFSECSEDNSRRVSLRYIVFFIFSSTIET